MIGLSFEFSTRFCTPGRKRLWREAHRLWRLLLAHGISFAAECDYRTDTHRPPCREITSTQCPTPSRSKDAAAGLRASVEDTPKSILASSRLAPSAHEMPAAIPIPPSATARKGIRAKNQRELFISS